MVAAEVALGRPLFAFVMLDRDEVELEPPPRMLLEELPGSTPALPAHNVHGHPMLLPLFSIIC